MTLGDKIHQLRKGRAMSQEDLAGQLTVSRQAISKWELNESVPDTENVVQLSKIFGVSTDYLLNDEYDSDKDIPAVKTNSEEVKADYRGKFRIASYCMMGVGLIGIITLLILSSVIPAWRTVERWGYPPLAERPANEEQLVFYEEQMRMFTSVESTGHLGAFLNTFNLEWLFVLCCLLVAGGIILLLPIARMKKAEKYNH